MFRLAFFLFFQNLHSFLCCKTYTVSFCHSHLHSKCCFFYLLQYGFFFVTYFYVEDPEILFFFSEVARVPAFLWTTIAVRNSRELGKMQKKIAFVCKSSDPTDFTAL